MIKHHSNREQTLIQPLLLGGDHLNFAIPQGNQKNFTHTVGHCYATLIKTDTHLIAFERLVYWEIQLIALMLMTFSKARAPELRMITRDSH